MTHFSGYSTFDAVGRLTVDQYNFLVEGINWLYSQTSSQQISKRERDLSELIRILPKTEEKTDVKN